MMKGAHRGRPAKGYLRVFVALAFFMLFGGVSHGTAHAEEARLYLSPASGSYVVGDATSLHVFVSAPGVAIKAIEGKLLFNPKEVKVLAVSRDHSVLTSWTTPPSFDNEKGEIYFGGWMASSTELSGSEVLSMLIAPERSGEFRITWESGAAILSADGTGGNVISEFTSGIYRGAPKDTTDLLIVPPGEGEYDSLVTSGEVLGVSTGSSSLVIRSDTNPSEDSWYRGTSTMKWDLPPEAINVRLAIDHKEKGKGRILYAPPISEKTFTDLLDGTWYFHVTATLADDTEETAHYRINIDREKPEDLLIGHEPNKDMTDPRITLFLSATDTPSGIQNFVIAEAGKADLTLPVNQAGKYDVDLGGPGDHDLTILAKDKAGNTAEEKLSVRVDYLEMPTASLGSDAFTEGDALKLKLHSRPKTTVVISYGHPGDDAIREEVFIDEKGVGVFTSKEKLSIGSYEITFTAKDIRGASSQESDPLRIVVSASIGGILSRNPLIPIALLSFLCLALFSFFMWRRMNRGEVARETSLPAEDVYVDDHEGDDSLMEVYENNTTDEDGVIVLASKIHDPVFAPTRL